jgi:putative ABC transport system ATP-binding protein
MTPLLEVDSISKIYQNGVKALDGVTIAMERGEFVSILGKSGSGKSTLLHILGGLDRPDSGTVYLNGMAIDFANRNDLIQHRRKRVGFIFQQFNLIPSFTALENVEYPLIFHGVPKRERRERAAHLLDQIGLSQRIRHYPAELSGGEQQRVAIARALVAEPLIVLADEPTGNLDSATSSEIVSLMREINRDRAVSFFVVTHDRDLAAQADRSCEIVDGRLNP